MHNTKQVFSFRTLVQKIQEALIHKRKRNGEFQPLNWFHILRWRLRWLNPFSPYNKGMRWSYFKMFFKVYFGPKPKELREGIDYDQSI